MRISSNRPSTLSWRPAAPGRRVASVTARFSSCRWKTAFASAPANAAPRRYNACEAASGKRRNVMQVIRVEKLTNQKWLNLFVADYEHNGRQGRWEYASRKRDPAQA